jgi:hypothetical protein
MRRNNDLGTWLAILMGGGDRQVVVLLFIHRTPPIPDIMAVALLTLHDAMDGARGTVLTVVLHAVA